MKNKDYYRVKIKPHFNCIFSPIVIIIARADNEIGQRTLNFHKSLACRTLGVFLTRVLVESSPLANINSDKRTEYRGRLGTVLRKFRNGHACYAGEYLSVTILSSLTIVLFARLLTGSV